ncbi:hypothetical protein BVZ90_01634 [Haemophilus influenzae]|uniref:Uncharacterized protein n=1 Tax=Haemophilus influenzae TaxID=727 RepID=A0ABD6WX42_HAEIF|nr:hypothetical protein BVZ90_01634 [Haemophilus influenzae]PRI69495.1 hypothetical protein BVZ92_01841 [Haemophilus influenzae]PRI76907.1 hypothetical protein BVZ98_01555 [Haemophilus influenzae]PRI79562.1 hypothetical protein BV001_00135 [Haemophilus influenzae]PRM16077.1 hypothetical protein BV000_01420 [Haemophilus influenzae]
MVASALVVSFSDAVIFTVLLEVISLFTVTFFALIVKPVSLSLLLSASSLLPDVSTLLFSVTLWLPAEIFESLTWLKVTFLASVLLLSLLLLPIVKSLLSLAVISALLKPEMFRLSVNVNSLVLMVRLASLAVLELELSPSTPALIVICLVILTLSEEMVRLPSFCEILPPIWISALLLLSVIFKLPFLLVISPLIMLF